jgi:hypothetical protein
VILPPLARRFVGRGAGGEGVSGLSPDQNQQHPHPDPLPPKRRERGQESSLALGALRSIHLLDIGVALFIGGHVISGVIVLVTSGQQRHAANLLAEWLGLGCAWIVLREFVVVPVWRSGLIASMVAMATAAAGLGIWQHQVSLPATAREIGPKIAAVREAMARGETHPFMADLAAVGVPTSEPGLTLYEKRLRDSREPFALFALANTLGGLLASALVLAVGMLVAVDRRPWRWWVAIAGCGLMAACLILTKSRTASIAVIIGLLNVAASELRRRGWPLGRMLAWCAGGVGAAVLIAGAAFATGVWDREVLAEAPKSLGYRWLYWQGTGRLIAEHPLLGVGLGQFRPNYLRVKLPEASEEIADPHNLILEAWVHGGLLAVIGLALCVVAALRWSTDFRRWIPASAKSSRKVELHPPESSNISGGWGVVGGGALAFVFMLTTGPWDDALAAMGLGWAVGVAIWTGLATPSVPDSVAVRAALLTLGVHLLAAGGGGMPAVLLWGLVLFAMSDPSRSVPSSSSVRRWGALAPLAIAGFTTIVLSWPDVEARRLTAAGDDAIRRGQSDEALRLYDAALERDRWNPDPAGRAAEVWRQRFKASSTADTASRIESHISGIASLETASARDPANGHWDHELGLLRWQLAPTTEQYRAAGALIELERASQKSPTNAFWMADAAEAAHEAAQPEQAAQWALRALQQDDLNRRLGHVERWLPDERRQQLEAWR